MLVRHLLLEGYLDVEIMVALITGGPDVERGGSKTSLRPYAFNYANFKGEPVGFLRDRDFDFDPPQDLSKPVEIQSGQGNVWGWYWCRHSIENYLLDPAVVTAADPDIVREEYEDQLRKAASDIRHYQAARWAVGIGRRSLPPHHELQTCPQEVENRDFGLPGDLSEGFLREWAATHTGRYLNAVNETLNSKIVEQNYTDHVRQFDDNFCNDVQSVLIWFSGKDLFAALREWLVSTGRYADPGVFRAILRDRVRSNPEDTLKVIPEWRSFVELLGCE